MASSSRTPRIAALVVAATAALLLAACGKAADDPSAAPEPQISGGLGGNPDTSAQAPSAAPTGSPVNHGQSSPRPTGTGTRTASATPGGPTIVYFRITKQPSCTTPPHGGGTPDNEVRIEWKVGGGATGAALSVDNPEIVGSYRTYTGTEGSETLNFPCDGTTGGNAVHKYTLRTVGGGAVKRSDLTATAKMPS